MIRTLALLLAASSLAACSTVDRLANVGKPPRFSKPTEVPAPAIERSIASSGTSDAPKAAPVPFLPLPEAAPATASLYRPGAAGLFQDQRARQKGDILTVRVAVNDNATIDNATERDRTGSENAGLASLLGVDKLINRILPGQQDASSVGANSGSKSSGSGKSNRSETINLTFSAIVTDVLQNGNLVIRGRQEMRVNYELRELVVTGLIRPQDIAQDNSIVHTRIAEARVLYGGRGHLTDAQQARYGQQIYDALFPF